MSCAGASARGDILNAEDLAVHVVLNAQERAVAEVGHDPRVVQHQPSAHQLEPEHVVVLPRKAFNKTRFETVKAQLARASGQPGAHRLGIIRQSERLLGVSRPQQVGQF